MVQVVDIGLDGCCVVYGRSLSSVMCLVLCMIIVEKLWVSVVDFLSIHSLFCCSYILLLEANRMCCGRWLCSVS